METLGEVPPFGESGGWLVDGKQLWVDLKACWKRK